MTSLSDSVSELGFDSAGFRRIDAAWESIPADKRPTARGALAVLLAADLADEQDPTEKSDPGFCTRPNHLARLTLWRMGRSHIMLCALDSFCDVFLSHLPFSARMDEAIRICDGMSAWFDRHGIRSESSHRSVRDVYTSCLARHSAGCEMRRMMEEAHRSAQKR